MKLKVQDELKQHFRPEFLNRVDDIVVFHQLAEEEIITIVDLDRPQAGALQVPQVAMEELVATLQRDAPPVPVAPSP